MNIVDAFTYFGSRRSSNSAGAPNTSSQGGDSERIMAFRVQKQGVESGWSVDAIYRTLSAAIFHCECAATASEAEEDSTFLIASDGPGGAELVLLIENGRLVHAAEGWKGLVPEAI